MTETSIDLEYRLEDRYTQRSGRVFLSGSQALVRLPLMQRQRDIDAGLNTAGFISGYTGSPLGGYDIALNQVPELLEEHHIHFEPGINEDLGATAVWGSQQVGLFGNARYDGVFGIWYGKGPGVDRSGDALKHGSYSGSAPNGGVLVLAGDDHGAKSSTTAHQSDHAFIHFGMPFLNPSSVQDYLDLGLHGFAMSRHSGCWIGMKCVTDIIESSASVDIDPNRPSITIPDRDGEGLAARWGVPALKAEDRQYNQRIPALLEYVRVNRLNREAIAAPSRTLGIVTSGKAYLDVMQALEDLGLDAARCRELGVSVFKVAMPWPLEPETLCEFAEGHREILVVEEKRPVIEDQIASLFVNRANAPLLTGKTDPDGSPLVPAVGETTPLIAARSIAARLIALTGDDGLRAALDGLEAESAPPALPAATLARMPSFCAGCPHNRSTKVPDGSVAFGGIGCHGMATFLPERNTPTLFQMGGEGAPWIGISPFTGTDHIFQNLGDGTYYHSGLLAIRAAVAAGVNITYKILANDAIAMTGGQEIAGQMRVDTLSRQIHAEGVEAIAIVSDEPDTYPPDADFAPGTTIHHRDEMDAVQRRMRDTPGVTAIIYDQNCATELRRRRKRGLAPDPDSRPFINTRVCEGCGDCSVQSNCIALEPVETRFGRKRRVNQSACNKDFSCTDGYCPSFVVVNGGQPRKRSDGQQDYTRYVDALPAPEAASTASPFSLLVTGIGGAGVVTLGAILGMAAHLEGKGIGAIDMAGLAQKGGAVFTNMRIGRTPEAVSTIRVSPGKADLVLGCDIVVTGNRKVLGAIRKDETVVIVNKAEVMPGDFARHRDYRLPTDRLVAAIREAAGETGPLFVDAARIAEALFANSIAANMFMLGIAAQQGGLPVSTQAIEQAIRLNGQAVEMNVAAFRWGRRMAHDPKAITDMMNARGRGADRKIAQTLEEIISVREDFLAVYHNRSYAKRFRERIDAIAARESALTKAPGALTETAARQLFKLMAIKDEFEVARLYTAPEFARQLAGEFDSWDKLEFHLAPPILGRKDSNGRPKKSVFGPRMMTVFSLLSRLKPLRFSPLNLFARHPDRRMELETLALYEADLDRIAANAGKENVADATQFAAWPDGIAGYGPVRVKTIEEAMAHRSGFNPVFKAKI